MRGQISKWNWRFCPLIPNDFFNTHIIINTYDVENEENDEEHDDADDDANAEQSANKSEGSTH